MKPKRCLSRIKNYEELVMRIGMSVVALLFGLISTGHAQKVYKWTDEEGRVHFSSTAPRGQTTQQVRIRKSVEPPPAPVLDPNAPTDAKAGDKPKLSPEQRQEMVKYCAAMRERISALRRGGAIVEKGADGSSTPLVGNAIAEKLRADEESIRTYCTANGV
jgi:hypothetical protein